MSSNKYKLFFYPSQSNITLIPVLLTKCRDVTFPLTAEVKQCIQEMKKIILNNDTFYKGSTLGISANQIGADYRIIYVSKYPGNVKLRFSQFELLFNTKIVSLSTDTSIYWEGCISDTE
jgi:peptide deformylase